MDADTIGACLETIKWKRFRDGSYSGSDPYAAIKSKLYKMREDEQVSLTRAEVLLLLQANKEGIQYIQKRTHLPDTIASAEALGVTLQEMAARCE